MVIQRGDDPKGDKTSGIMPWIMGTQEKFSTKEAYMFTEGQQMDEKDKWKQMWRIRRPQRLNLMLWQTRSDKLVTESMLYLRKIAESPVCRLLGLVYMRSMIART